jgi:hypothetical protein
VNEEEKARVRAWKRGMEEVNRITREENRRRTPEERLAETLSLMDQRGLFGRDARSPDDLTPSRKRWRMAVERMCDAS